MVSLVFCPPRQPKPGSSTRHLHGLVEHAELNQRVEAGGRGELPGPGANGTGAGGTGWLALASMDCPGSVPGQHGAEKLPGGGRQHLGAHRPWGILGPRWAEACRSPAIPGQHA